MAGFIPDEGEQLRANVLAKRTHVDRDADFDLGLFTNVAPGETITHAALTEPTGGGYARITLTDASWSVVAGVHSYALQTFTAGAGGYTGSVQGYFIATKSAGGTKRLVYIEVDASGPYTMNENATYKITPNNTET